MVLSTTYIRDIVELNEDVSPYISTSYTEYDLFCLRSRIVPFIQEVMRDEAIDVIFPTTPSEVRRSPSMKRDNESSRLDEVPTTPLGEILSTPREVMRVLVIPISSSSPISMSRSEEDIIQREIDRIIELNDGLSLLYRGTSHERGFYTRLIEIDEVYNPTIIDDNIYINLSRLVGYPEIYDLLNFNIERQIAKFKELRYTPNAKNIADSFELDEVIRGIYKPRWIETRIHDPYFLQRQASGDRRVKIRIPPLRDITAIRHVLAEELGIIEFTSDGYFFTQVYNIVELRQLLTDVEILSATASGTFIATRVEKIEGGFYYMIDDMYFISKRIS